MSAIKRLIDEVITADLDGDLTERISSDLYLTAQKECTPALSAVVEERHRQDDKWGEQNHNPYIYLAIHTEELGELAQALLHTQYGGDKGGWENVRKEAIHAAATALALVECLDRDLWVPDDVSFKGRI